MKVEYRWELMLEDGFIIEGEGNQKALIIAMTTPGVVDGDIWWGNSRKPLDWWKFLLD